MELPGTAATTRVAKCRLPPRLPPHPDRGDLRDQIRRLSRCLNRSIGRVQRLVVSFAVSLRRGNEVRACKLLTDKERRRLGGSACPESLAGLAGQLRLERAPSLGSLSLSFGHRPRGELDLHLVHPLEAVAMRFEAEHGFWRLSNVRDLLRPAPPPSRGR